MQNPPPPQLFPNGPMANPTPQENFPLYDSTRPFLYWGKGNQATQIAEQTLDLEVEGQLTP